MKEEKTQSEKVRDFIREKLDSGFELKDRDAFNRLKKEAMDKFDIPRGSMQNVKIAIHGVMADRGLVLDEAKLSDKVGNLDVTFSGSAPTNQQKIIQAPPIKIETQQTLEQTKTETKKEDEPLPPSAQDEYKKMMATGFSFIAEIYMKLGIIETDGSEEKQKPMTPTKFKEECEAYGATVGDYCFRHNVKLPMWIELASIVASGFMIFGLPIFNNFFFKEDKLKKDESADKVIKDLELN